MGYKLNRVVQKEEQAAAYTRKELELMSEYRLREVCLREHIVKGLDKSMTNEELIEMILSYCQTFDEDLIREEKEGGRERIEECFDKFSVKEPEKEELRISGKISIYEGAALNFLDDYKIEYKDRFLNTNALIVSGDNKVCAVFNVVAHGDKKDSLFLVKEAKLSGIVTDTKDYSLYLMERDASSFVYRTYMGEEQEKDLMKYTMYKIPLMDFEILPLIELHMPIALDLGSTNTTVAMYADSSYYRQLHTAKQRGIKENTICHTLFFESVGGETFIENMIPTVVAVTDVNNDGIEYVFGRKALWFANLSYTDKGFSVFYDIKRWVGDFEKKEELTDAKGRYRYVARIEIIAEYLRYVLNITRDNFKCLIKEVYITVPVKQKHVYEQMLELLSEMLSIKISVTLDESTAVLYSFISKMREKNRLKDGESYKALIMDCGGGTTDLSACKFKVRAKGDIQIYTMENSYKNGNTDFGGNNITYRIMQILKLRIVSKLLGSDKDLGSEVINDLPGDPYRYIDEEGVENFYKGLQEAYQKVEEVLPTAFKNFETYGKEGYYRVRNNYFFLFTLADEIKQELFSGNDIAIEVPEGKKEKTGLLRLEADRFKLSVFRNERLEILEGMPKISFNRYEAEKLIAGEIYAVMKVFMERLYKNGELYNFDMIRLTGQSCKIGLFRDALKEFVPGNMMQSGGSVKKEELKLACVDGLMRYLYDKRTGYAGFDIREEEALIPYKIKALSYSGKEEVLIDGFESNKMTGSLLRSLEDILLRMYLYDASESIRYEYLFHFKKDEARATDRMELAGRYSGYIKQEDTDDIQNDELKIFAFVDYKKWGFQIVPVYRLEDTLYAGEGREYKFETDEWICDFFDGEH